MLKKKLNLSLNNQLLNIDILQKYILKDINKVPKIKQVILSVDLNDINIPYLNNTSEEFIYQYSTFILYNFGCLVPHICLTKKKVLINNQKNFNLKIVLNNKTDIENLLCNIFFNLLEKEENIKNIKFTQGESNCNFYASVATDLYISNIDDTIPLLMNISFSFDNNTMKKNFIFKKYPHFWIF